MTTTATRARRLAPILALAVLTATGASAAGFNIFEQGSRAMGMAGAFTAQADDPSALFHNVGGLGFFTEEGWSAGLTVITATEADFVGDEPFPGPGVSDEMEDLLETPVHAYWVKPINEQFVFGLAVNTPYGLTTEWDADTFSGRFLTTRASLVALDIVPSFGLKLTDRLSVGASLVTRVSTVELDRAQSTINPFTLAAVEIARASLESDVENGFGWQVGLLHKPTDRFSWGFTYRSRLDTHYNGTANFVQVPTGSAAFDALIADRVPFDTGSVIDTDIKFPDTASLGFAYEVSKNVLVEVDANWAGWNSFDEIVVTFEDDNLDDLVLTQLWEEVNNYRLGIRWTRGEREWRFGYVFDENPIPDETVGPLLPDSDRNGFTVGWGQKPGNGGFDFALMYLPFDERTTSINESNFNGTYNTTIWLAGITWSR